MIGLAMMLAAADVPVRVGYGHATGEMLYQTCQQTDQTACIEFVTGAADMISYLELTDNMLRAVCQPPAMSKDKLVSVVVAFLDSHPEQRRTLAGSVVFGALYEAYLLCP